MASQTFLWVKYWDKKLGGKSEIRFAIEDTDSIKDIIKHLRSKRLRILEYGITILHNQEESHD